MLKNNNEWGKQVRIALIKEDMTLKELAELIGYSPSYVRAVVGGKLDRIEKIQHKINDVLSIDNMQVD